MMKPYPTFVILLFLHLSLTSASQPGQLDKSFGGGNGVIEFSIANNIHTEGDGLAIQPDGRILVLGASWNPFYFESAFLARFREDGSIDSTFNGTGKMIFTAGNGDIYAGHVHVLPDGKILTVIMFSTAEQDVVRLYRLLPDGTPDPTFDDDGLVIIDPDFDFINLRAFTLQPDGKMILAGYAGYDHEAKEYLTIVRVRPDGEPDTAFDQDGIFSMLVGDSYLDARSIVLQADGKIIAAGYAVFEGEEDVMMVRILPQGTPDLSFGQQGVVRRALSTGEDRCNAMALQPDGRIVLGCNVFNTGTGKNEMAVARCMPDGSPDTSFDDDGFRTVTISGHADGLRHLILQPDGKILLAGYVHSDIPGGSDMAMVRLNSAGTLDMSFHADGVAVLEWDAATSTGLQFLRMHPDGRIIGTGRSWKNGASAAFVAAFESGLTVGVYQPQLHAIDVRVYPNPASDFIYTSFRLTEKNTISIRLMDINGQWIRTLLPVSSYPSGEYQERFSLIGLAPGQYWLVIEGDLARQAVPVMIH